MPCRLQLRHPHLPRLKRVPHAGALGAESSRHPRGMLARSVETDEHLGSDFPRLVRGKLNRKADEAAAHLARTRQKNLCSSLPTVALFEHDLTSITLVPS